MNRSRDVQINEDIDFEALVQNKPLLQGLEQAGYERPSPIQLQAIPLGRLGVDLVAQAKSGTGKTVVFGVIALETVRSIVKNPQVLMVAPTREIAVQIRDVVRNLAKYIPDVHCEAFIGGLATHVDVKRLKNCQIVVGTPGRLMALLDNNALNTNDIKLLVMDEADKLMSEVFGQQVQYINGKLPKKKQTLAFSATFTDELLGLLQTFMHEPHIVRLTTDVPELQEVQQYYKRIELDSGDDSEYKQRLKVYKAKFEASAELLSKIPFYQCMIFVNSVPRAVELSKWLTQEGWMSGHISGSLTQVQRNAAMEKMRDFKLRVLVCSDLIARGIDIDRVNLVINIDFPREIDTYMHRVGRTGRFGTSGIAVNLISPEDESFMDMLEERGVHLMALPEHVSYSEFRKALSENEEKLLKKHESRLAKKGEPKTFTALDKMLKRDSPQLHLREEAPIQKKQRTAVNKQYPPSYYPPPTPAYPPSYSHPHPSHSSKSNHFIPPDLWF
ncbi:P-loop containing nucleoside triphosphate hydrolase protein [Fennellomyces sp. T-0311]|nr:P-loop containing nucleoside triphosphate hydrolase protein [Fennellomyces sp. T-0311]